MSYSKFSPQTKHFSHRLDYNHQVDVYQANPQSQIFCQKYKQSLFRIRSIRSKTLSDHLTQKHKDYNKYYIKPELRYKKKNQDPKKKVLMTNKQSYFYDNLHNQQFWEWKHPFEKQIVQSQRKSIQDKINPKILEKFKSYMEENSHARLPLVVRSALQQKI